MEFTRETNPRTKRFERSLRMANLDQARLVAEDALGRCRGDQSVRGRRGPMTKRLVSSVRPGAFNRSSVLGLNVSPRTATWRMLSRRSMPSTQE